MKTLVAELHRLMTTYGAALAPLYKWEDERARWNELAFCLVAELGEIEPVDARSVTNTLADLGLLDRLTDTVDEESDSTKHAQSILVLKGVNPPTAERIVRSIREAAQGLKAKHGNLQGFLRLHGEEMLRDLRQSISLSTVDTATEHRILATWLQNAVELPVPNGNRAVAAFCAAHSCTVMDLVRAADAIHLNFAVVDDLIQIDREQPQDSPRASEPAAVQS